MKQESSNRQQTSESRKVDGGPARSRVTRKSKRNPQSTQRRVRKSEQLSFLKAQSKIHGGATCSGNPREKRPLSTKLPIHLVLKSRRAVGERSFLRKKTVDKIKSLIDRHASANGVKVYRYANAGNHLHLVVRITNRDRFSRFLRVVSGLIARLVLNAQKGEAKLSAKSKFWDARPFTRVADWGRSYKRLCDYLTLNTFEALGFIKHSRGDKRQKFWTVKFEPDPPADSRQASWV